MVATKVPVHAGIADCYGAVVLQMCSLTVSVTVWRSCSCLVSTQRSWTIEEHLVHRLDQVWLPTLGRVFLWRTTLRPIHITVFDMCIWSRQLYFDREIEIFLYLRWCSPLQKTRTAASSVNKPLGSSIKPENTHSLCKEKCHCTADLMFDSFGFNQTC